jgi:hypothetical protein
MLSRRGSGCRIMLVRTAGGDAAERVAILAANGLVAAEFRCVRLDETENRTQQPGYPGMSVERTHGRVE